MALKRGPKIGLIVIGIACAGFGLHYYLNHGATTAKSTVPTKGPDNLADFTESTTAPTTTGNITLPTTTAANMGNAPKSKMLILAWNAQMGLALANGGPATTEGSLMQKQGVNLVLERQDDYEKMQEALVSCANELSTKGRKTCTTGANFVTIMGDGGPTFLAGVNPRLAKLGSDYIAEIVGSSGRSYGEDKFMAPQKVKDNAQNARGLVVSGVLKDGDWNIAMFWAGENEICNNPDVKTYDPNCLNWVGTSSFVEADDKYIQSYCEDRAVVNGNKKTGSTQKVCVNAVVTWTPGDVAVAKKKGGLVSVLSTRENSSQMPQVIIGIRKWDRANRDTVKGILRATFEGGDQIKRGGKAALSRAASASAKIYNEETAAYWAKYYVGVEEEDVTGVLVSLGGSRVFNLADNLKFYGLEPGSANAFAATYTTFGNIAKQQYPADLPTYPALTEILDLSYIQEIAAESGAVKGTADTTDFSGAPATSEQIAKKSWRITFATGSAQFTGTAQSDLDRLLQELVVAGNTVVEIHGHTDNTGDPANNMVLSQYRAAAVKTYLEKKAPGNFPAGRIKVFPHGQTNPLVSNDTAAGQSQNRRVEIVLKSND